MNQIEKTEIIISLIAIIKSRLITKIFSEKKTLNPDIDLIKSHIKKMQKLEILLRYFYEKLEVSDHEFQTILNKIKIYENF